MTVLQDEDVIRAVLDGHVQDYHILVDRYKNIVYDLCFKYTYDHSESQDLSQEIFLKAYRKLFSFKNSSSFFTWLYRIGINTCIDWSRKNRKHGEVMSIDEDGCLERFPSPDKVPEEIITDDERRNYVRNAVVGLPEKYRAVVILYNYKNLSCPEISSVLCIPVKTVETRLYRAKRMLKDRLLKSCDGGDYVWNVVK